MPDLQTINLLNTLGLSAYSLAAGTAVIRYRGELQAIGRGFRRLVHEKPLDPETVEAIKALHIGHEDQATALCRAYGRIVAFNFDPSESDPSLFLPDGTRRWPDDGSEWLSGPKGERKPSQ